MQRLELKATHKSVQNYYAALRQFDTLGVTHETAVRSAFQGLLDHCAHQYDWTLVPEWEIRRPRQHPLRVDGALLDNFRLTHGSWEAKDMFSASVNIVALEFSLFLEESSDLVRETQ